MVTTVNNTVMHILKLIREQILKIIVTGKNIAIEY